MNRQEVEIGLEQVLRFDTWRDQGQVGLQLKTEGLAKGLQFAVHFKPPNTDLGLSQESGDSSPRRHRRRSLVADTVQTHRPLSRSSLAARSLSRTGPTHRGDIESTLTPAVTTGL